LYRYSAVGMRKKELEGISTKLGGMFMFLNEVGLYKFVLFYYKTVLLPDAAWKQIELVQVESS
jgi:hypothetical protein